MESTDKAHHLSLILGPFQGKVACQTIGFGRGVCGTAAAEARTVRVADVEAWPGHIACDGDSRSEIVVPVIKDGVVGLSEPGAWLPPLSDGASCQVVAIIDLDCAEINGFDQEDERWLVQLAVLLAEACDW